MVTSVPCYALYTRQQQRVEGRSEGREEEEGERL